MCQANPSERGEAGPTECRELAGTVAIGLGATLGAAIGPLHAARTNRQRPRVGVRARDGCDEGQARADAGECSVITSRSRMVGRGSIWMASDIWSLPEDTASPRVVMTADRSSASTS